MYCVASRRKRKAYAKKLYRTCIGKTETHIFTKVKIKCAVATNNVADNVYYVSVDYHRFEARLRELSLDGKWRIIFVMYIHYFKLVFDKRYRIDISFFEETFLNFEQFCCNIAFSRLEN